MSRSEGPENALHDRALLGVDAALTGLLAARDGGHDVVAVGEAAGDAASSGAPELPALGLVPQVGELHGRHDADMHGRQQAGTGRV